MSGSIARAGQRVRDDAGVAEPAGAIDRVLHQRVRLAELVGIGIASPDATV